MVNNVPWHLINFECYKGGGRLIGLATIDLPELAMKTTELSGAGILGTFNAPTRGHTDNLELVLHFRTLHTDSTELLSKDAQELSLRGAWEMYEAGTGKQKARALRIDVRGVGTNLKAGKFESGEPTETELTLALDYIMMRQDGAVLIEIDKFNYIYKVGANDYLADVRSALGR